MEACIIQAAQYMRYGNHREADHVLRELQANCTNEAAVQCALHTLENTPTASSPTRSDQQGRIVTSASHLDRVYRHFIALKLLRSSVLRARGLGAAAAEESSRLVTMLLQYAHHRLADSVLQPYWRPVLSELCTTMAALLKWSCVNAMDMRGQSHAEEGSHTMHHHASSSSSSNNHVRDNTSTDARVVLDSVMSVVNLLEHHSTTPATRLLHRTLIEAVVIEFGLYTTAAQTRGLTMSQHRHSRRVFEQTSALPRMVHALLQSMLQSTDPQQETSGTIQAGWSALVTTLAWGSHCYFMDQEMSEEESCMSFAVDDPYWDELLLHGIHVDPSHPLMNCSSNCRIHDTLPCVHGGGGASEGNSHAATGTATRRLSLFELLSRLCLAGWAGVLATPSLLYMAEDVSHMTEALQLLCCFRGKMWAAPEVSYFVHTALHTCVSLLECRLTAMMTAVQENTRPSSDALPVLSGAVRRLMHRYADEIGRGIPSVHPLLLRLSRVTEQVMEWDAMPRGGCGVAAQPDGSRACHYLCR